MSELSVVHDASATNGRPWVIMDGDKPSRRGSGHKRCYETEADAILRAAALQKAKPTALSEAEQGALCVLRFHSDRDVRKVCEALIRLNAEVSKIKLSE